MLVRLFSETGLLRSDVRFQPGINIILGKYSGDREARGINGIGKSTLVRLIDYCLLSDGAQKIFSKTDCAFLKKEDHNIILEFKVKEQTFFIKRSFTRKNRIGFGESLDALEEYDKGELRSILIDKFFPTENRDVFFEGQRFRSLMNFFIKDDLESQKRINPLNFIGHSLKARDTAIYNCFLLGLPTRGLIAYKELMDEYESYNKTITGLTGKMKYDTGKSIGEFKSDRAKLESRIEVLESGLGDYKFLDSYKNVESQVVELTAQINDKLKEYHSFNHKLNRIKESYRADPKINTQEIRKIYNDVLSTFGDIVSKTLEEIEAFKKTIIENRKKYFVAKELQLEKEIASILEEISQLEKERSRLYKMLEAKGALDSLTGTYEQLITLKADLEKNLHTLKQVDEIQTMLDNLDVSISKVKMDIQDGLREYEMHIHELRRLFQDILANAVFLGEDFPHAYFDISSRRRSRREQLPFSIGVEIPKADALGQSRLKITAYDLMVFLNNINAGRELPTFLIHDGVFHGISRQTVVNVLNYIYKYTLEPPGFQYITTFNDDEIHLPGDRISQFSRFDFDWQKHIIASYEDVPEKMIFKREF